MAFFYGFFAHATAFVNEYNTSKGVKSMSNQPKKKIEEVRKKPSVLSGGEKVRCMLSRMMLKQANVLLLDEPTNHLDLESITALNNGLINYKGAMIFTSHDHQFVQTIANRIIDINDGKLTDKQLSYDEYLEWSKTKVSS